MAKDIVIQAAGLGKKYIIGHQSHERHSTLRDSLAASARNFARTAGDMVRGKPIYAGDELEEFWALRDVSFEVKRGEVLGIIGRNGAGKSTLLKLLSRITEPSKGRIEIKGRVASLLEVGTGFHPELTGRENIYLNGAILGMTRTDIRRKFDEIVAFSGVEKFLDTPVKRYSSGMYVRLAFAVAAHLEPEILIIDEVLAVGDAEFQRRCLGKMESVARDDRTVIFVSHNMAAVESLCTSSLVLTQGRIELRTDDVREAVRSYSRTGVAGGGVTRAETRDLTVLDVHLEIEDVKGTTDTLARGDQTILSIVVDVPSDNRQLNIGYALYQDRKTSLWWSFFADATGELGLSKGRWELKTKIPTHLLSERNHTIEIIAATHLGGWIFKPGDFAAAIDFAVIEGSVGSALFATARRSTILKPNLEWNVERSPDWVGALANQPSLDRLPEEHS